VQIGADRIHAQQLAGHLETGNLFDAVAVDLVGLEVAQADRVQVLERIADAEQVLPRATLRRRPII
jgi:cytosine/adenosine deaminase-related metal-dependent hydrolase